jgi:cobyrinic acid a,c-diamide synthase
LPAPALGAAKENRKIYHVLMAPLHRSFRIEQTEQPTQVESPPMTANSKHEVSLSVIFPRAFAFRFEALLSVLQQPPNHGDEWRNDSSAIVL